MNQSNDFSSTSSNDTFFTLDTSVGNNDAPDISLTDISDAHSAMDVQAEENDVYVTQLIDKISSLKLNDSIVSHDSNASDTYSSEESSGLNLIDFSTEIEDENNLNLFKIKWNKPKSIMFPVNPNAHKDLGSNHELPLVNNMECAKLPSHNLGPEYKEGINLNTIKPDGTFQSDKECNSGNIDEGDELITGTADAISVSEAALVRISDETSENNITITADKRFLQKSKASCNLAAELQHAHKEGQQTLDDNGNDKNTTKPSPEGATKICTTKRNIDLLPKLVYFGVRGLAEPMRYLLAYGMIDYNDVRINRAQWVAMRKKIRNCQLPIFVVERKLCQNIIPMAQYIGDIVGLGGKTPLETLIIAEVAEKFYELYQKIVQAYYEPHEHNKQHLILNVENCVIPFTMMRLEMIVKDNDGYFALKKLTWADIFFAGIIEYMNFICGTNLMRTYPRIIQNYENVMQLDDIKKWIKRRPITYV